MLNPYGQDPILMQSDPMFAATAMIDMGANSNKHRACDMGLALEDIAMSERQSLQSMASSLDATSVLMSPVRRFCNLDHYILECRNAMRLNTMKIPLIPSDVRGALFTFTYAGSVHTSPGASLVNS